MVIRSRSRLRTPPRPRYFNLGLDWDKSLLCLALLLALSMQSSLLPNLWPVARKFVGVVRVIRARRYRSLLQRDSVLTGGLSLVV